MSELGCIPVNEGSSDCSISDLRDCIYMFHFPFFKPILFEEILMQVVEWKLHGQSRVIWEQYASMSHTILVPVTYFLIIPKNISMSVKINFPQMSPWV